MTFDTSMSREAVAAGVRIYRRLSEKYEDEEGLFGPDEFPFTSEMPLFYSVYPLYRFLAGTKVLSYPRYRYVQAQAYWILGNLFLFKHTKDRRFLDSASTAGNWLTRSQREDGSWSFPLPGWRDRVNTVYCTWGALSLVKLHRFTGEGRYLESALRWKDYLFRVTKTRKTTYDGKNVELVQYSHPAQLDLVPNASTLAVAFLSNIDGFLSGEEEAGIETMVKSIACFQQKSGEIAYSSRSIHYICPSYNGFEFVDLFECARNHPSELVLKLLQQIADYLLRTVTQDGLVRYDCGHMFPQVHYHSLIVAGALHYATLLFHENKYAKARDKIVANYLKLTERVDFNEHARHQFHGREIPDRAFFARQMTYNLVNLLRIGLVKEPSYLDNTLI